MRIFEQLCTRHMGAVFPYQTAKLQKNYKKLGFFLK